MIDTTVTDGRGNYRFRSFAETGDYQIRVADTGETLDVLISNGSTRLRGLDFDMPLKSKCLDILSVELLLIPA